MKKVAIIGTHGIPAKYGGFETLAEQLVKQLNKKIKFTVYCNKNIYEESERGNQFYDSRRIFIPISASGWQSYIYDLISFIQAIRRNEVIIYLGPTSGYLILLNFFFKKNIITNYGGLNEWERPKYNFFQKLILKFNIYLAAKFSTHNVVDNSILKHNLSETFKCKSTIIRYGGDHVLNYLDDFSDTKCLHDFEFINEDFYLAVARAQKDSKIDLLIEAFENIRTDFPLVIISNWDVSDYGKKIKSGNYKNTILLNAIYDKKILNYIRSKCKLYIHSHSYCGTAPSLVEAMSFPLPVICLDVPTNRETTRNECLYFKNPKELQNIITKLDDSNLEKIKKSMNLISNNEYLWSKVAGLYEKLIDKTS